MHLLVLPVSGGGFPSQLAMIQHLCEINYKPDLIASSSGGNVAAYVSVAANFQWPKIELISRDLTQELFVKPWSQVLTLSYLIGFFKGDVNNKGTGVTDLLTKYFSHQDITEFEIWTGTYNKRRQKARLFCNRSKEESILRDHEPDLDMVQALPNVYADGDIDIISQASIASASIPALVPAQIFENEPYVDGGIAGASPLIILQEPVLKYVENSGVGLHITYINCLNLNVIKQRECNNVIDNWRQAMHDLIRFQTVNDRLIAYNMMRVVAKGGNILKDEFKCNKENMERVRRLRMGGDGNGSESGDGANRGCKFSLLEMYPSEYRDVDITGFNGDDVVRNIRYLYDKCRCRLWWVE